MRRNVLFFFLIALVVATSLYFFLRPVSVQTSTATIGPAALFVYASGQVIPEEKIILRSKAVARINRFFVDEGQNIVQGELLVLLEGDEAAGQLSAIRSELAQFQTDLDYKEREYARIHTLFQQQAVSLRDHDNALTSLRSAESALRKAQANVDAFSARMADYSLTSPFSGIVLEKLLDSGAMVTNNDGILSLATLESMIVEGKVDELDADKVKIGQKVLMSFDSTPGKVFEGTVRTIAPRIDYATKSFKIKIQLPPEAPHRSGMSAELNILVQEKPDALMVPINALSEGAVWVVRDGRAIRKIVVTGLRDSRKFEILEGINAGDIVIENPTGLSENKLVQAVGVK